MLAYLTMMTARLQELHRVLKKKGSLYLHCDPTASHYLKAVLDGIFGPQNYRTEISWRRQSAHNDAAQGRKQYGNVRDIIFFYTKSDDWQWNQLYTPYSPDYVEKFYRHVEAGTGRRYGSFDITAPGGADPKKKNPYYEFLGVSRYWRFSREKMQELFDQGLIFQSSAGSVPRQKRYLDEMPGVALQNDWDDIRSLQSTDREKLGYPTQKPLSLLERIVLTSSQKGDTVLDPFCGCGTALHAAEKNDRRWIGIDVAVQSMQVVSERLKGAFPRIEYDVYGLPTTPEGAEWLAARDPFKFEEWAVSRLGAMHSGKYRNDGGVDGYFYFMHGRDDQSRGIVSVKAGRNLNPGMVRDLAGTLARERSMTNDPTAIAVMVCAREPTEGMLQEARRVGSVETMFGKIPALQILSARDIFAGKTIQVPLMFDSISAGASQRRRGKSGVGFVDPREIFRQRQMLLAVSTPTTLGAIADTVLPQRLSNAG